ncbi:siderophore-interacting protein [Undibacterium sp. TJN19]|uniref:siderophore-interacting protein n=1 Tax=Undibacterium sp. TJN19 TaxID=3413055 RepID=UPI003BF043D3
MNTALQNHTHFINRIYREKRKRSLTVIEVIRLTPHMQRITFHSPDLCDFESAAHDDHIKILLPVLGEPGAFCRREYTPRSFDVQSQTLTIDFALHQTGPANDWARHARIGDRLDIVGPGKSIIVTDDFDWYLLIGDETALPAIGRRVEQLRHDVHVTTIITVAENADRQTFNTVANWTPVWIQRDQSTSDERLLLDAAHAYEFPSGDGYIWIAAERQVTTLLRTYMTEERGHSSEWLKASAYWTRHSHL